MSDNAGETNPFTCKAIVAIGSVALYIMYFQLEIISAQVAIAFNIPVQTTSIYLEKLFGVRFLAFLLGVIIEYLIFRIYTEVKKSTDKDPYRVRVIMNQVSYGILLIGRIILFLVTCFSSNLAYHVYFALAFEAFGIGAVGGSIYAVLPQHGTVIVLFAHLSRFLTFLVQFVLDLIFGQNPLAKIRCQFLFCTILNVIAVGCFHQYHEQFTCSLINIVKEKTQETKSIEKFKNPIGYFETFGEAASPFFMYMTGSLFFDTLFPGVLPYAYLTRERCHLINMVLPLAGMTGPIVLFCLETAKLFDKWEPGFDAGWIWAIPMSIIFVYSILAVHTRIPSARKIINNRPRVLAMTFISSLGNSFLDPLSFAGVAKVLFMSENFIGDVGVLMTHQFFCISIRFLFYKVSVGYNVTRISLGYIFPKFRPNHRMSKWNTFWYVFKNTFRKAGKDAISDITMNVKEYL